MGKNVKRISSALGRFSNSTVTGDDTAFKNPDIADYTVTKKVEGSYKTKRILYWVIFFSSIIALFLVGILLKIGPLLVICAFGILLAAIIVKFFTWKYFDIQYSYAIEHSEFFATEIYGEKADKLLVRIKMNRITRVAPYSGEYKAEADCAKYTSSLFIASSPSSSDLFYLTYQDGDNGTGIVYFDACSKALKAFKYFNSSCVTMAPTSR